MTGSVAAPPAASDAGSQASSVEATRPLQPQPTAEALSASADEQVWERTHLEQRMFTLAREHALLAASAARGRPPDRDAEQTHSLVAILMSFLALEAFINMVGGDRLGPRYRHYDRMSPEGKWMEVTRLVSKTATTFEEEGHELRTLSLLRTWRNVLTHYKGEYEEVQQTARGGETKVEALLCAANAARAVEIARALYRAFYVRDRRSPPRQFIWLDDRPHHPPAPPAGAQPHQAIPPQRGTEPSPTSSQVRGDGAAAASGALGVAGPTTGARRRRGRRRRRSRKPATP